MTIEKPKNYEGMIQIFSSEYKGTLKGEIFNSFIERFLELYKKEELKDFFYYYYTKKLNTYSEDINKEMFKEIMLYVAKEYDVNFFREEDLEFYEI